MLVRPHRLLGLGPRDWRGVAHKQGRQVRPVIPEISTCCICAYGRTPSPTYDNRVQCFSFTSPGFSFFRQYKYDAYSLLHLRLPSKIEVSHLSFYFAFFTY